jgi:NitT/TauT family transport system substrate-binding protein
MSTIQTRRRFLTTLSFAGAAGLLPGSQSLAVEGALETTSVRLGKNFGSICIAPQYVVVDLLRAEGFTQIHYVEELGGRPTFDAIGRGELDFSASFAVPLIQAIDDGVPIVLIAGVHVGCHELFARGGIRNVAELKGKTVGLKASPPALLSLMAAHVGLDPVKDIVWVTDPAVKPMDQFVDGKIDAFLAFPPEPQELHARGIGHVIVKTAADRPWSQYFCCMLAGNAEFVRSHPVATKRVVRAILKAADLCAAEPERVARRIVDDGFTDSYDWALQTLRDVPYDKWREYDAEDTIRFYALRLRETSFIKSSPQKIIAGGTDWRFFDELKRELKA